MPKVIRRERAKRDLIRHYAYLGEHANLEVAERFVVAARTTFETLSRMPLMGIPRKADRSRFANIRLWPVDGFTKYLVVYLPIDGGVQIERVIHAAEDYRRVLSQSQP